MIKNKINVSKGDGIIYTFVMQAFIGSVSRIRPQVICQNRTYCCMTCGRIRISLP